MHAVAPRAVCQALAGLALLLTVASSGCLCTFERDWRLAQRRPQPADQLAGLWEGTWLSDANGHNGKLRAIITNCGNGQYHARYHATFALVIPYSYDTMHTATRGQGVTYFSGEQDLGCLAGGVYHYNGSADGMTFVARYRADKDHGVFTMRRVGSCGAEGCGSGGCACVPECDLTGPSSAGPVQLESIAFESPADTR